MPWVKTLKCLIINIILVCNSYAATEVVLARETRFRQQRIYKFKIVMVVFLFFTILFMGLLVVDLNKSYILYGEPRIELFKIKMLEQDICQINILNSKFDLNLKYIKKDVNNIKSYFKN